MRLRSVAFVAGCALVIGVLLVLPSQAEPLTKVFTSRALPPAAATNLARATEAPLGAAHDASALAARLHAAKGSFGAIETFASPDALALAESRVSASPHGSFADEVRGLRADEGRAVSPADEAALARAASFPPAFSDDLARVLHGIRLGAALSREALAGLAPEERAALPGVATRAASTLSDHHASADERAAAWAAFAPLASRVDRTKLDAAGLVVAAPVDALVGDVQDGLTVPAGSGGSVLLDLGDVVIGGTGSTSYSGFHVLVVDLGGSDTYADTAGGVPPGAPFPVSVVVDLGGSNDVYEPSSGGPSYAADYVEGAAFTGVGLLVDDGGDDTYSSAMTLASNASDVSFTLTHAQGFGMLGVGALVDLGGNDAYASRISLRSTEGNATYGVAFAQGSALDGIGVLVDARGLDAYDSVNDLAAQHALQDAFGTWSAEFCEGSGVALGAGALVEGADPTLGTLQTRPLPSVRDVVKSGSDLYNSRNTITSLGGTEAGGYGGQSNFFALVCQGAGATTTAAGPLALVSPIGETPPVGTNALTIGVLADADGADQYGSDNTLRAFGYNHGGVSPYCRSCHTESNMVSDVVQGAAGESPLTDLAVLGNRSAPPRAPLRQGASVEPAASVTAGVLVDGLGDDAYNSGNDIATFGYVFPLRPTFNIIAESTFAVAQSQGYGGTSSDNLSISTGFAGIPLDVCGKPTGDASGCPVPPSCEHVGRLPVNGLAAPAIGPSTLPGVPLPSDGNVLGCFVGAMVDAQGDDRYDSGNRLAASGGDTNYEDYVVSSSLGAASHGGIGVHVDGPVAGDTGVKEAGLLCPGGSCLTLPSESATPTTLGSGSDLYASGNVAPESRRFEVTDSLGSATEGIAAHVDASVPLDAVIAAGGEIPGAPAVLVGTGIASQDSYDSANQCTVPTFARNYGFAHAGLAAFVSALSTDLYDQDPGCAGAAPTDASFGFCQSPLDAALFIDLGGNDAYPLTTYPASGGGPANELQWSWGPPFSFGLDAASSV
ncbi:MAG: hypothetical protein ACYDCK_12225 [Thermoplasmatota archaeon]